MRIYAGSIGVLSLTLGLGFGCSSSSEPEKPGEQFEAVSSPGSPRQSDDGEHDGANQDSHVGRHDHDQDAAGACTVAETSTQRVMTFDTKEDCDDGALEWHDQLLTTLADGTITDEITIKWHHREIFHTRRSVSADKSYEITTDYAAPLTGVKHVVVSSADGHLATALVDGRVTRPFVPAPGADVRFLDGKRAPEVRVPPPLERAARKLFERAPRAEATCLRAKMGEPQPPPPLGISVLALPSSDHGHPPESDTHLDPGCLLLLGGEYYAYGNCLAASAAGLACGPLAWICVPGIALACSLALVAALDLDNDSSLCCPAKCGGTNFTPTCCEKGDRCLSEGRSLCCAEEKVPCHGTECCNQGDSCLANGTCCPAANHPCGTVCCDQLETCTDPVAGTCCPRPCGNKCCTITEACDFSTNECIALPPPACISCTVKADCFDKFGEHGVCDVDGCCKETPF